MNRIQVRNLDRLAGGDMHKSLPMYLRNAGKAPQLLHSEVPGGHTNTDSTFIRVPLRDHPTPQMDTIPVTHWYNLCTYG
jgi:hypothetical protein